LQDWALLNANQHKLNNRAIESKAGIAALVAANSVGVTSGPLMPLIVGALAARAGLSVTEAGLILAAQFAAIAISSLIVATRVDRWNRRLLCALGIGLVFIGNSLSMITDSFTFFLAVRFLTGLGEGTAIATVNGTVARAHHPQRLFALIGLSIGFYSAAILLSGGFLIESFGTNGIFGMAGLIALILFPTVIWFPGEAHRKVQPDTVAGQSMAIGKIGILGLFGYAVLTFGYSSTWAYLNSIGGSIGLSIAFVGTVLAVGAIVAPAGSGLAHVIGTRFGSTIPVAISLLSMAGFILLLGRAQGEVAFTTAVIAVSFLFLFVMPYLLGALSVLDPSGRLPASSSAFLTAGIFFGAGTGGMIVSQGFAVLTQVSFAIILLSGALIYLVTRLVDLRSTKAPHES